jgi:hypothetical protein
MLGNAADLVTLLTTKGGLLFGRGGGSGGLARRTRSTGKGGVGSAASPTKLAAELHIKENHLAVWKREGFGPPRTRVRQLIMYRREAIRAWLRSLEETPAAHGEDTDGAGDQQRSLVQRARPPPSKPV